MNGPDVLGMVLPEAIIALEKNDVLYSIQSVPKRAEDETKTARIIRQRFSNKYNTTELLIAYF